MAAAGLIVAVGGPFLGALVDQLGRRKPWIAAFTWLAVLAAGLMWFIQPEPEPEPGYVVPALVLLGLGTIGSELAFLLYNAMLPSLAPEQRIGKWSGWGWGAGYAGGLLCLCLALFAFVVPQGSWLGLDSARAEHVSAAVERHGQQRVGCAEHDTARFQAGGCARRQVRPPVALLGLETPHDRTEHRPGR